jgi:hypothetical protein
MFVFDVLDTYPEEPEPRQLPLGVENPFEIEFGKIGWELDQTIENAKHRVATEKPHHTENQCRSSDC